MDRWSLGSVYMKLNKELKCSDSILGDSVV